MGRLLVQAVAGEGPFQPPPVLSSVQYPLCVVVSVSRAEDGTGIPNLNDHNFLISGLPTESSTSNSSLPSHSGW